MLTGTGKAEASRWVGATRLGIQVRARVRARVLSSEGSRWLRGAHLSAAYGLCTDRTYAERGAAKAASASADLRLE